ncbi:MAG: glutamate--cysteine ligase [Acidiferrobacteraceae bacterium]|jgi:glutamate--cysteine ligase
MTAIEPLHAVPHLTTALTGPLYEIERHMLDYQTEIEQWFRAEWRKTRAPFYASVDLRNSGFKLAPVDTNLFPAGFNNLNPAFVPLCIQAVQSAIERVHPEAFGILLVPENHTRNTFYLENLASLREIIELAGFQVRIGSLLPDLEDPMSISLPSGRSVLLEPLTRNGNRVGLAGFDPCLVLLNNDLSSGRPEILEGIEQPVVPPLDIGWTLRRKSDHFAHYQRVAREFAEKVEIDPWLIDPYFRKCGKIDFMKREGEDCLAKNVGALLEQVQKKYAEYKIDHEPFVIVKAERGTYGMGIMMVRSVDEVRQLSRKQRTKMARIKEGQSVSEVIIQEGVYSFETWAQTNAVAEPVVYMIGHHVVGGFYRVHTDRGPNENLNAPGMHFEPLAFEEPCTTPDPNRSPDANPNRFYAYGVISRLALLAAARELASLA